MLAILKIIGALLTALTGVFFLLKPGLTSGFTGLQPAGGRGLSELRSLGGLFIALGLYALIAGGTAYQMLGWSYLGLGLVRLASIFYDKSPVQSNWVSLGFEILFGILLVLP